MALPDPAEQKSGRAIALKRQLGKLLIFAVVVYLIDYKND
jgi:hypothetical protein